ncbi:MAG: Do family serine endopeptidase [Acidobacteria bacterium]|nr:Do family serine endopeptidase [Acidobacteriota bacterium]MBV9478359.1 Do family serine endopeptidase [Acidobacteriota bacterium]
MNQSTKRILSTIAIVIASVAFGVLISADLGLMKTSKAQTTSTMAAAPAGSVGSVMVPSFADVASRVMPAVVSIRSTEVIKVSDQRRRQFGIDPFEFFFPDPRQQQQRPQQRGQGDDDNGDDDEQRQVSGGSGFIISPDGYILTNNHVIEGASTVVVHYGADENGNGGQTTNAKIVGHDPATDLALLKIDVNHELPSIRLGDSDRIRKGDWAIAIGHPFTFENTLTVGVISAKGRSLGLSEQTRSFENFIQTDAAINFGNSGGPLLNIAGEVIGINTAIRGGGAQGIGFATPINTARTLLPQLKKGKVTRGFLGMSITDVTEETREAFNLPEARGALVQDVTPDKPADRAGIRHGDVIVEIDGRPIRNNRELIDYISYLPVGTEVHITLLRNSQRQTVTAKTAERPPDGEPDETENGGATVEPTRNKLGMSVQNLTAELRRQYNVPATTNGVIVTDVKNVSAAADAGISEGDVISEVQGQRIDNVDQFRTAVDAARSGQRIRIYITTPTRTGPVSTYRIVQTP